MSELNIEAERAAPEYARVREEFELATKLGARFDIDSAMLNVDALLNARRAAPVGEVELPALPAPAHRGPDGTGSYFDSYTAEQVRQAQHEAIAADRAARAQQQAQSVDTPEFRALLDVYRDADYSQSKGARERLIAYIDGRTAGAAPEGWKLVPVEPTEEMIQAACLNQASLGTYPNYEAWWNDHSSGISEKIRGYCSSDYKVMVAAAPSPQQGKEGGNGQG